MDAIAVRRSQPSGTKDQLRFIACGSVDDGKSTLIGRLLYDCKAIFEDQLAILARDSTRHGTTGDDVDLALLVDGLEAERAQGITIDVAYRFFTTPRRSFIVADAPGHEQYTRNMVTGASNAQAAIVLVDARKGVLVQTRRHSSICSLLGIRHVVLAVNKIDLLNYEKEAFDRIVDDYFAFAADLGFTSIVSIPISARYGDNVINRSDNTEWYLGPCLLDHLESVDVISEAASAPFRFPVQWVNRPNSAFRGYAGTVASGYIAPGDEVVVAASGRLSRVKRIITHGGDVACAGAGDAITITLDDEVDVGRGDVLSRPAERPDVSDQFAAHLIWMDEDPLVLGRSYILRVGTQTASSAKVTAIEHRIDINTGKQVAASTLELNEIAFCNVAAGLPLAFDSYNGGRKTGAFILIDRYTNRTIGAGMIATAKRRAADVAWQPLSIGKKERASLKNQKPFLLWFTGLSGSGKSTIANIVDQRLFEMSRHTMLLDGDDVRQGLNRDLGFTKADRVENIRRVREVAKLMVDSGLIVICSFISPYKAEREAVRSLVGKGEFIEVFVDTPIEECAKRDPKGLYAKVKSGEIDNFTGIDASYEAPTNPEIRVRGTGSRPEQAAEIVVNALMEFGLV